MAEPRLLDNPPEDLIRRVVEESLREKGRRLAIHSLHKWWSRRFAALYRFILSSYLSNNISLVERALEDPTVMRNLSKGKTFFEPFAGGGTGLVEAALAGWRVYGVDINPVATRICRASLMLAHGRIPSERYFNTAVRALDRALKKTRDLWIYREDNHDYIVSYTLITRGSIAPWISTYSSLGKRYAISICSNCLTLNTIELDGELQKNKKIVRCGRCGEIYELSLKASIDLDRVELPTIDGFWKVYALELREIKDGYVKRIWISLLEDYKTVKHIKVWLRRALEKALRLREEIIKHSYIDYQIPRSFKELRRFWREANISRAYQLFTPRQLASFYIFIQEVRKLTGDSITDEERELYALAISEASRTSCIAARWYPPLSEPLPAGSTKFYWVPEYNVEVNPLAHIWGTLRPLARGTIASTIRRQRAIINEFRGKYFVCGISGAQANYGVFTSDAAEFKPLEIFGRIDLCAVDPPYPGNIESYAELSFLHKVVLEFYDRVVGGDIGSGTDLEEIIKRELNVRPDYEEALYSVFSNVADAMNENSRLILMYNTQSNEKWEIILRAAKRAGLSPLTAFWTLGEAPGKLARSSIRGILIINMHKSGKVGSMKVIFKKPFEAVASETDLEEKIEARCLEAFSKAFKQVYNMDTSII